MKFYNFIIILFGLMLFPSVAHADPVSATVMATLAGVGAASEITAGVLTLGFSWGAFAASLAMSAVSSFMTKKPKGSLSSYDSAKGGMTQQFRQSVADREIVYGEIRKSGPVVAITTTGSNRYCHMLIALAAHPVSKIGEIMVGDVSITDDMMDAEGNVISGRYAGYLRIRKHLGAYDQAADTALVSEWSGWSSAHRLRGIAYIYARMRWSSAKYPSGIPNFSAWVQGKELLDPRSGETRFSQNIPLMIRDYLADSRYGRSIEDEFIHQDILMESANLADEYVGVTGESLDILSIDQTKNILKLEGTGLDWQLGDKVRLTSGTISGLVSGVDYYVVPYQRIGVARIQLAISYQAACAGSVIDIGAGSVGVLTKIAEPRYHGGGVFKMSSTPSDNIDEMISSCAGTLSYSGGMWRIMAGGYRLPVVSLDESDLAGPVTITTRVSKRDRFNRVQGIYTAPINDGNPASYPAVKNSIYEAIDGGLLKRDFDQAFSQRPAHAERVGKILLEKSRQEIILNASFKLSALQLQVGDNFYFSFARYGWSGKIFEVTNWKISAENNVPVIEMTCRETSASCYDWAGGSETVIDPAPNTALQSIWDVDAPTDINISVYEIATAAGDKTYQFNVTWTPPDDAFVTDGGWYEVEFKESTESDYRPSYRVDGAAVATQINQVRPGVSYDIRIRSFNTVGVSSGWSYYVGFTVTSPTGADFTADYGTFSEAATVFEDAGTFSETATVFEDDGTFSE